MNETVENLVDDRLRLVLETIDLVALELDDRGRITFCNDYFCQLTGWFQPELLGRDWFETCIPPACRDAVRQVFLRTIAEGEFPAYYENEILTRAGETRLIGWHNTVFRDEPGQVTGVTSIGQDITAQREAEAALRRSEEKHRTLFDTMVQGVVYQDEQGNITSANPAAERILGLSLEQMQGRSSLDLRWQPIHEDGSDFPGDTHPAMVALKTGREIRDVVIGVFNPARNDYRWLNIHAIPLFKPGSDRPTQVYTTFEDITERKQAEEAYRALVEYSLQGLVILQNGSDRPVVFVNPAIADITGYAPEKLLSLSWNEIEAIIHPDDRPWVLAHLRNLAGGAEAPRHDELRFIRKDGAVRWVETFASATDYGGRPAVQLACVDITERKQAEQEIKLQAVLLNAVGEAVMATNLAGEIIFWNRAAEQMYGWQQAEVIGRNILDITPAEELLDSAVEIMEQVRQGNSWQGEFRVQRKDGTNFPILVTNTPLYDDQNNFSGVVGVSRDISERKRAEADLKKRNQFIETILDNLPIGLAVNFIDEGAATYMNREFEKIYGWPREELTDIENFFTCVYPDPAYRQEIKTRILASIESGDPAQMNWEGIEVTGQDGQKKIIAAKNIPLIDQNLMISTVQDITERKIAEKALLESEAQYRRLVETSHDLIWAVDTEGRITFINQAAERIYGRNPQEMIGRLYTDFIPPDQIDRNAESWASAQANEDRVVNFENWVLHKEGRRVLLNANAILLRDNEGNIIGSMGTSQDITERKRREQELLETKNLLEKTFASLDEAVLIINATDRTIITCNPAVERIFGYAVEELLGESTELLHVDPAAYIRFGRIGEPILEEKGIFHTEYEMRRRDGQLIITDNTVTTITAEAGWQGGVVSVVRDITDRKRAEESLRQYADRLQTLHDIDRAILAAQSPVEIAQVALRYLREMISCRRASVVLYDFKAEQARILAVDRQGESRFPAGYVTSLQDIASLPALQQGQINLIDDLAAVSQPGHVHQMLLAEGIRTYVNIPLLVQGRLIGSLNLGFTAQRAWLEVYREIAQEVADQLAIALHQAQLFETERLARHTTEVLYAASAALTGTLHLNARLEVLLQYLAQLVPYDSACVMLREGDYLTVWARRGYEQWTDPDRTRPLSFEIDPYTFPAGWKLVYTQESVLIPDTRQDPDWRGEAGPHVRSWLGVPLIVSGEVIGLYSLDKTEADFFTEEHLRLAEMLAGQAAVAIQNGRFYQQIQHHARELEQWVAELELQKSYRRQAAAEERQRLARELHDAVSQTLFSASVIAETLPRLWERNPEAVRRNLAELHRLNRAALAEMRTLLLELRPAALAETELADLLKQLADALAGRSQAAISFKVGEYSNLPTEVKVAFFRIAQEALNNIAKHARPDHIKINLNPAGASQAGLTLQILDDGRGFDPNRIPAGHLGLTIMQERADAIGATLTIISRPGHGTQIALAWPGAAETAGRK